MMIGRAGRLLDCPACGYGFVNRRKRRCPRCEAWLVYEGETFLCDKERDRVFLWLDDDRTWAEVLA